MHKQNLSVHGYALVIMTDIVLRRSLMATQMLTLIIHQSVTIIVY